MDETIEAIINKITVHFDKPTTIKGGHKCVMFFDCAMLSPSDLARLAAQATGHIDEEVFNAVVGIAYSGILFAAAIAGGRQVNILQKDSEIFGPSLKGKKILIVDDVIATGNHLYDAEQLIARAGGEIVGYGCIVDRSGGKVGTSTKPLYSAHQAAI